MIYDPTSDFKFRYLILWQSLVYISSEITFTSCSSLSEPQYTVTDALSFLFFVTEKFLRSRGTQLKNRRIMDPF